MTVIPKLTSAEIEFLNTSGTVLQYLADHYAAQASQQVEGSELRALLAARAIQFRSAAKSIPLFAAQKEKFNLLPPLSSEVDPVISADLAVYTRHPEYLIDQENRFTAVFKASDVLSFHGLANWSDSTEDKQSLADTYAMHLLRYCPHTEHRTGHALVLNWLDD